MYLLKKKVIELRYAIVLGVIFIYLFIVRQGQMDIELILRITVSGRQTFFEFFSLLCLVLIFLFCLYKLM